MLPDEKGKYQTSYNTFTPMDKCHWYRKVFYMLSKEESKHHPSYKPFCLQQLPSFMIRCYNSGSSMWGKPTTIGLLLEIHFVIFIWLIWRVMSLWNYGWHRNCFVVLVHLEFMIYPPQLQEIWLSFSLSALG